MIISQSFFRGLLLGVLYAVAYALGKGMVPLEPLRRDSSRAFPPAAVENE
jgi:hypothetical protein